MAYFCLHFYYQRGLAPAVAPVAEISDEVPRAVAEEEPRQAAEEEEEGCWVARTARNKTLAARYNYIIFPAFGLLLFAL